jgi:hypothetical protein
VKNKPNAGILTGAAVVNSGITTFVFFSVFFFPDDTGGLSNDLKGFREFVVTPSLVQFAPGEYYARRRDLTNETPTLQGMTLADLRWNKLLDSGMSGLLTGAVLRRLRCECLLCVFRRHSRDVHLAGPILPGAMVVGATATALQYVYNELSIMRLRYVSNYVAEQRDRKRDGAAVNKVTDSALQSLLKLFGVVPISDEEYLEKLRRSREIYLQRIAKLEEQIEEDKLIRNTPTETRS